MVRKKNIHTYNCKKSNHLGLHGYCWHLNQQTKIKIITIRSIFDQNCNTRRQTILIIDNINFSPIIQRMCSRRYLIDFLKPIREYAFFLVPTSSYFHYHI